MTDLDITTKEIDFSSDGESESYKYSSGAWVGWSYSGATVYGKVKDRTKGSFTVDGNKITGGGEGSPVYKMEEYDTDQEEMTGQMVAKPQSSLSKWSGAPDMAEDFRSPSEIEQEVLALDFETGMDREKIVSMWDNMTNMSEEEMEMWDAHPCADAGVDGGENTRDTTLMLMGQYPDGWNEESYRVANKHLAHIMEAMKLDPPEDPTGGGPGSCPHRWTTGLLNRGVNPLDMMPSGNPNFDVGKANISLDLPEADPAEFSKHEELDEVYSKWSDEVNMTASQLESWSDHPCADEASQNPSKVRKRNMGLLEKSKSDWTKGDISDAKRTISFISRMKGSSPDGDASEGGKGSCPSEWAVSLLNWAYNPFDGMPDGEPNPDEQENSEDADGLTFAATAMVPQRNDLTSNYNEHGISRNFNQQDELVSVDAVYEAMEAGPPERRNGVRVTNEFLQEVADKDYSEKPPYLMDHNRDTLSQIGQVQDVWFNESSEKLMLKARVFNTGSPTHEEIISRLTFDPPTITDGSIGFSQDTTMEKNDDGETVLEDGRIREFSTTPFPAGYDDGGLKTE